MSDVTPEQLPGILLRFRRILSVLAQMVLVVITNWAAYMLRFDGAPPPALLQSFWAMLPWLVVIRAVSFFPFRLYEGLWRYTSMYDLRALVGGVAVSSAAFYTLTVSPLGPESYPRSVIVMDAVLLLMLLGGVQLTRRFLAEWSSDRSGRRVLIVGAGSAGELIARDMTNSPGHEYELV